MYLIVKDKGVMKDLGIINKIRSFFKTPNKLSIRKGFNNWFKFYNSNLANNETIFSAVTMKANAIASAPVQIQQNYQKLTPYEHNLAYLFKFGPNPRQTMFNFIQFMEASRNTNSGAYAIIEYDKLGDVKFISKVPDTIRLPCATSSYL